MKLKLVPKAKNTYPLSGVFIKSTSMEQWLISLQEIGFSLGSNKVYPVPGTTPNSLYGCIVIADVVKINHLPANCFKLQLCNAKIYVTEYSVIAPALTADEWQKLFDEDFYFWHPEVGLLALQEPLRWEDLIEMPQIGKVYVKAPLTTRSIPKQIKTFYLQPDESLFENELEKSTNENGDAELPFNLDKLLKGNKREMEKFLNLLENDPDEALNYAIPLDTLTSARGSRFNNGRLQIFPNFWKRVLPKIANRLNKWAGAADIDNTINYNKEFKIVGIIVLVVIVFTVLYFIISIVNATDIKPFRFPIVIIFIIVARVLSTFFAKGNRRSESSFKSNSVSGGGIGMLDSTSYQNLYGKYQELAEKYIDQKQYKKAAHVYHKLLKNSAKAAQILEEGKFYNDAAYLHLKYTGNKKRAAECFEKGKAYAKAFELYKELELYEKAGDMVVLMSREDKAVEFYLKAIDNYISTKKYIKAAQLYTTKLDDPEEGRRQLFNGWMFYQDVDYLDRYLDTYTDEEILLKEINEIRKTVSGVKVEVLLKVLKKKYTAYPTLQPELRQLGYELIAERIATNALMADELKFFNTEDKMLRRDILRYKTRRRVTSKK